MKKDIINARITWKNTLWVLFLIVGCGFSTQKQAETISENFNFRPAQANIEVTAVVSFHEVYRSYDEVFWNTVEIIPKIDGFIPIYELDFQNYPPNVVGVTDNEEKKKSIIKELMKIDSIPENSFFCWSKNKIENLRTNETFYQLYLLKEVREELRILNSEIRTSEVQFHQQANQYIIYIKFNESGTEKWTKLTKRAAFNANDFIAIVIDSQVYSIPMVMDPIYSGESMIFGFDSEKEATKMVERIKNSEN